MLERVHTYIFGHSKKKNEYVCSHKRSFLVVSTPRIPIHSPSRFMVFWTRLCSCGLLLHHRLLESHTFQRWCRNLVTPIKWLTIPRLELCGAQLLARLIHRVWQVLDIPLSKYTCGQTVQLSSHAQYILSWGVAYSVRTKRIHNCVYLVQTRVHVAPPLITSQKFIPVCKLSLDEIDPQWAGLGGDGLSVIASCYTGEICEL